MSSTHPALTPEPHRPVGMDLNLGEQMLHVTWADGVVSRFPLLKLRKHCPCASCRTERDKQSTSLLPILSSAPTTDLRATSAHLVGNYALQIEWSDGHGSGIYDFRLLRHWHDEWGA